MKLILQTGAHYTEQERLTQTLLRNTARFADKGVVMPHPDQFRRLMRDTLNAMHRAPLAPDASEVLMDAFLSESDLDSPKRVILSDPNFFRTPGTAVQEGRFYPDAAQRMTYVSQLFPEAEIEIFMAIRNPAALLPILHSVAIHPNDAAFWGPREPHDLRWSELLAHLRSSVPEIPITVWCNEDMPLGWSEVLRAIANFDEKEQIAGGFDLLMTIMSTEGMQRFRSYLSNQPAMSEAQRRRVIMAFLDKFALEDEIEEELEMSGWTDELVEELTDIYDADMAAIEEIPGVRLVSP